MTTDQIKVLSKGLKFIPKPLKSDKVEVQEAFDEFSRRVKIPSFFKCSCLNQDSSTQDSAQEKKLFVEKSEWIPPDKACSTNMLQELKDLKESLGNIKLKQNKRKNEPFQTRT